MKTSTKLPKEESFSILIVEPDTSVSQKINEGLRKRSEGLEVERVESPKNAIELLKTSGFDAILSEISFENQDPTEYIEEIREIHPDLPMIVYTGLKKADVILQCLNKDVDYYLVKDDDTSSEIEEIFNRLKRALREIWEKEREESLHADLRHDLRNKLQIVQGYLELMKDDGLTEEQEDFLEKSFENLREGAELIEEVRTFRKNNF
ncbi:MAG: response regulator [Candidatus Hadarchaeota archaeon]